MYWRWWWLRHARAFLFCSATRSTYLTHKHIKLDPHSSHFLARPLSAKPGAGCDCKQVFFFDTPAPVAAFYIYSGGGNSRFRFVRFHFQQSERRGDRCVFSLQANNTRADWAPFFQTSICCCSATFKSGPFFVTRQFDLLVWWQSMQVCNKTPNSIGSVWLKSAGQKTPNCLRVREQQQWKNANAYFTGVRAEILTAGLMNYVKKFSSTK
jgi:hypothetical protein